jgi:L-lactate dehydrogenase complex protein LldG
MIAPVPPTAGRDATADAARNDAARNDAARNDAARTTILARVREALQLPAPPPHLQGHGPAAPVESAGSPLAILPAEHADGGLARHARPWLPDGGETPGERLAILWENLAKLRAVVHVVPDIPAAAECVFGLARERDWQRVAWHDHPLVEPLLAGIPCGTLEVDAASGFDKDALEACDAGVTACESLVAQTGSILVDSGSCGGRALSILPHVHVVVATTAQIVATLGDALEQTRQRHAGRLPSMLAFITGPSRTGDIERILVLGAHGPKELVVILIEDEQAEGSPP